MLRDVTLRAPAAADAERIAAIYDEGEGVSGCDAGGRTRADAEAWIASGRPFLVAEDGGEVVGFARVGAYEDSCGFAGIGEQSVYLTRAARGHGLGRRLLEALAEAAAGAGYHKLTARIVADNAASIAAHRAAGFDVVGTLRRHGRVGGEWKDSVLVERLIGDAAP